MEGRAFDAARLMGSDGDASSIRGGSDETEIDEYVGKMYGGRLAHPPMRWSGAEVDVKNGGTAFFGLRTEVQPATSSTPHEVEALDVDEGTDVEETSECAPCHRQSVPMDGDAAGVCVERDVLLSSVDEKIAEKKIGIEFNTVEEIASGDRETTPGFDGSLGPLRRTPTFECSLQPPDGRGDLERDVGVVMSKIDVAKLYENLGMLEKKCAEVVFAVGRERVKAKELSERTTRRRRHLLRRPARARADRRRG